jgi:cysteine desulfurase family protein (TIGR01976 family)
MFTYLTRENANVHGAWATSQATDRVIEEARQAVADFLGAGPNEIAFGQNMTTLNFALSRALGRGLHAGDEIIITDLDHEANRGPWLALEEKGAVVRSVRVDPETCALDLNDLKAKLGPKTRILAVAGASNAVGTVNDLALIGRLAREAGALFVVDAVHLAPHKVIDVKAIGCDFLLCSAYKFFGPHLGVLYGRREAFEGLETYRLRPQSDEAPFRIETGTLVHEGIAGTIEAIEFIAGIGRKVGAMSPRTEMAGRRLTTADAASERRRAVVAGMEAIDAYEQDLADRLLAGLGRIPGLKLYGPPAGHPRTPTISFRLAGHDPEAISQHLAGKAVFAGAGDFYALTLIERLDLAGRTGSGPGLLRMGLAPYNTRAELERVVDLIRAL